MTLGRRGVTFQVLVNIGPGEYCAVDGRVAVLKGWLIAGRDMVPR